MIPAEIEAHENAWLRGLSRDAVRRLAVAAACWDGSPAQFDVEMQALRDLHDRAVDTLDRGPWDRAWRAYHLRHPQQEGSAA